jgi:predicted PurR-regulated permease PerM
MLSLMGSKEGARRIFIGLILVALGLVFALVLPFGAALVFATVLAAAISPLHRSLTRRFGGRVNLSAGVLCLAVLLLLLLPLGSLGAMVIGELVRGANFITETVRGEGMSSLVERMPAAIQAPMRELLRATVSDPTHFDEELRRRAGAHGSEVAAFMSKALAKTGAAVVQGTMSLIALFFLLVDGRAFVSWLEDNSPLMRGQVPELLAEFRRVSTTVLISTLVTSGVQALTAALGYAIAGVPHPFFFALVTFFISFVPAVGAGGVCLTAALLLLSLGKTWAALFLAIWVIPVGLVDNLVKPLLVQRGMHMHGGIVFFALIGGIAAFGAVGLLLGPLFVTLLVALVRIYRRDFSDQSNKTPNAPPTGEITAATPSQSG